MPGAGVVCVAGIPLALVVGISASYIQAIYSHPRGCSVIVVAASSATALICVILVPNSHQLVHQFYINTSFTCRCPLFTPGTACLPNQDLACESIKPPCFYWFIYDLT
ncbi:hypothetical protein F5Y07DRAFT_204200 [Xylaria sp. FL0933]|nr:hypothetical protein F5Y07DRAFT_204200 [Xylaria sp. FL0933]